MHTLRHYLISDDLDDLEQFEEQLESAGIENPQIHVLSNDAVGVANHKHLHAVQSLFTRDIVHSTEVGALVGIVGACIVLGGAYVLSLPDEIIGWMPYIFLSIVVLGFCTWEGGLIGIQSPNHHFKQFEKALSDNKHVFLVDLDPEQEPELADKLKLHPGIVEVSTEAGGPHWLFSFLHWMDRFIDRNLYSHATK